MANFGNFCILLALCLALYAFLAALAGAYKRQPRIIRSAERAVYAAAAAVTLALLTLLYLLLTNDFSVAHVASSSSIALPLLYKIAAVWGGHDGSMLLWVFFSAIIAALVVWRNRARHREMMPYVVAVLMANLAFFLALNVFLSNPFKELVRVLADGSTRPFIPADGQGLNPLLQYWAMVIHPPVLYLGFIGFVVPFAFAIAALAVRQRGEAWIHATRQWTLWTWLLLGFGLILGGKWAYVVLGWGGYWGWDPVENASLMPWLTGTAFLHSVIVQERRGMLKIWNIVLVVITYLLGIFGTFLTRSGIVSSVHAFADANISKFFLYFMALALLVSLVLLIDRRATLRGERRLESLLSRESAFLFNNLILLVACFAIFWGTMFPVFSEWIRGVKISVGPVFFNKITVPIGLLLLLLTGIGPFFAWRKTSAASLLRSLRRPGALAVVAGVVALLVAGVSNVYVALCFALCALVAEAVAQEFFLAARVRARAKKENFFLALERVTWHNKQRYGGYIVHFAVALIFVGLAGNAFNEEANGYMRTGQEMRVGRYTLKMAGLREGQLDNYQFGELYLDAYKDGQKVGTLRAERRLYDGQQATTTVGLRSTPLEDLYVVYMGMTEDRRCEVKARVNPLVFWVWAGSALMFLGTLLALGKKTTG